MIKKIIAQTCDQAFAVAGPSPDRLSLARVLPTLVRHSEISNLNSDVNILGYQGCSFYKLSSLGIKVPDREPWEINPSTEENNLMATKKKAAKKKKH